MREQTSPTPSSLPPTSDSLPSRTPSSSSCSSSSPPSVLSHLSSQSSSLSTSFTSYSPPPRPSSPTFSFFKITRRGSPGRVSSKKKSRTKCTWVNRFFKPGTLSMEAAHDEGLLLQKASEGFHGSWGDTDGGNESDKPKKELRFAAKIAAAMDADGFIGVKNSVCADDRLIGVKHSVCTVKEVNAQYCVPTSSPCVLQRSERAPLKQGRPRRRWKLLRRMRRSRVLFACLFRRIRKAFTSSSTRTLKSQIK